MRLPRSYLETLVREVRTESHDAVTLVLDLQGASFTFRPGQFIEIDPHQFPELAAPIAALESAKHAPEGPRGFSICSDGSDAGSIEISVKEDAGGRYPPLLSPWLVRRAAPGRRIRIVGPFGKYCLPQCPPEELSGYLHLCAGSGVAPNRGMIRFALQHDWPQRHLLILQNRTLDDVFYRDEWPLWQERFPGRFRFRHVLSVDRGLHVSPELIRVEMADYLSGSTSQAMVCGPNRPRISVDTGGVSRRRAGFCESWCGNARRHDPGLLASLGFTPDRILTEMW